MNSYKCGACDESLSDGAHCTICNQELHFHCAGITEAGYRKLGDRRLTWRCSKCKISNASQPPSSPRIEPESLNLKEIRAIAQKLAPLETLRHEITELRSEFADLKSSLSETNTEIKEFNGKIKEIEARLLQVEKVVEQVDLIHARLDKLEEGNNTKEQWTRMNNIEIKGLPQNNHENLFDIIGKIGAKISYPVSKAQINFITRVPSREKDHTKPIIVCFLNLNVKEGFIAAARLTVKTAPLTTGQSDLPGNQRIFINDHLTLHNKALLSKTKKMAAEMDFRYVWVKHSKIHARKTEISPTIVLKNEKDLIKIK
ncbi:uncharacterized protein LOC113508112 [Trichoplusia ni]|uniref:Uncharacterized protein LOC113508111 n=1 Tax=Trichoplusia ni TaxID=7111 RepID=A0A7E5X150_TRINI|nr:uncharacterized protein LOC113508111 [Trichoplusia ni]XP_026746886.1 uncharacterized protein LOC113508112 [Trichoplusia ni]